MHQVGKNRESVGGWLYVCVSVCVDSSEKYLGFKHNFA